jgi:nucleotide-binding universal stress UspA family protein
MIPQIKRILYATDLSKNSAYAFYYAVDIAQKRNAQIVIVHVVMPVPAYARFYAQLDEKAEQAKYEEIMAEIQKRLKNFCEKVDAKVGTPCLELVSNILVRVGHPVEEILQAAEQEGCDMILLGSHGKGFLTQTFLGSVSRSVLDRTRRPVFIIPLPPEKVDIPWDKVLEEI